MGFVGEMELGSGAWYPYGPVWALQRKGLQARAGGRGGALSLPMIHSALGSWSIQGMLGYSRG